MKCVFHLDPPLPKNKNLALEDSRTLVLMYPTSNMLKITSSLPKSDLVKGRCSTSAMLGPSLLFPRTHILMF